VLIQVLSNHGHRGQMGPQYGKTFLHVFIYKKYSKNLSQEPLSQQSTMEAISIL
jgi:hypothetical protein